MLGGGGFYSLYIGNDPAVGEMQFKLFTLGPAPCAGDQTASRIHHGETSFQQALRPYALEPFGKLSQICSPRNRETSAGMEQPPLQGFQSLSFGLC